MRRSTLGLVVAAGLLLVACGDRTLEEARAAGAFECPAGTEGCDPVQPVGPGGDLTIEMGDFFLDVTDGVAVTGDVEVTVVNVSGQYHNAEFLGAAEDSELPEAEAGEDGTATVKLFPGEWTVICNVPGHRAAGMETTITVFATEEEAAEAEDDPDMDPELDAVP